MTDTAPVAGRARHLPGDASMWVFVLGDLVIFGAYFVIFMVYRARQPALFLASQQHLSLTIGVVNTLVLITSSWFVARGVQSTRCGDDAGATRLTAAGAGCGVLFMAIKGYEWTTEIRRGLTLPHNDFFMFYYTLTGVHLFHVLVGLVFLAATMVSLRRLGPRRVSIAESSASYWHMVDLLWIVIFALLYVMR